MTLGKEMKPVPFFEAFGKLANAFAWAEGDIRRLLAGLAFNGDFVIASTFLDSSQLRSNLKTLRKLSRSHKDHEELILEIARAFEQIVDRRNLFIHGIWTENTFSKDGGFALVRDLKTRYRNTDGTRTWASGQGEKIDIQEFRRLFNEIRKVTDLVETLINKIEAEGEIVFPGHTSITSTRSHIIDFDLLNK